MTQDIVVGETAVNAYFDRELDESESKDVEQWLQTHPTAISDLEAWLDQKREIKKFYDRTLKEPVPRSIKRALRSARPEKGPSTILRLLFVLIVLTGLYVFVKYYLN